MNIDEINQVFADVNAKISGKGKASDIHRDYELERMVNELDTVPRSDYDVKNDYIKEEYNAWMSAMESLNIDEKIQILAAFTGHIIFGVEKASDQLSPLQKTFYHAGVRLFKMKVKNEADQAKWRDDNHRNRRD